MTQLTDNKVFDDYVAQFGWVYDNGGQYRGEHWDWYAGPVAGLVLLRKPPDRIALVRYGALMSSELWSGQILSDLDFDRVMSGIGCSRLTTPKPER